MSFNYCGRMRTYPAFILSVILIGSAFVFQGCGAEHQSQTNTNPSEISTEQQIFWDALRQHCGNAYQGELADATPYYLPFDDSNVILHIRDCSGSAMHLALHIGDDRSRNLMLTKVEGTLQLKHDHRYEDGNEESVSQYGGKAPKPGLVNRQIFRADAHTTRILPQRYDNFWFLDIMDETTLAYGVHWPTYGHSIRIEFDTSAPVSAPPAPWGFESN